MSRHTGSTGLKGDMNAEDVAIAKAVMAIIIICALLALLFS